MVRNGKRGMKRGNKTKERRGEGEEIMNKEKGT